MIKKILSSEQSKINQINKLKEYSETLFKFPGQLAQDLKGEDLQKVSEKFTSLNFGLTIDVLFNGLSIQQCFHYCDLEQKNQRSITLKFLDSILKQNIPDKFIKFSAALERHSSFEKGLVILTGCASHCLEDIQEQTLPTIFPKYIRICSFIIEKHLQLKNQPAKNKDDRVQLDKILLDNTEKWVKQSLHKFFRSIPIPTKKQIKHLTLLGLGDLMGALLEILRENTLSNEILESLLNQTILDYVTKSYSLQDIQSIFIEILKNNKFWNPIQKIQIPEVYSLDGNSLQINTQAYCYLIVKYLEISSGIYSNNEKLKILIVAASEILSRPYEIKVKIIKQLFEAVNQKNGLKIEKGNQFDYPIALLLFYFWQFKRQQYKELINNISADKQIWINMLISFKQIVTDGLGAQQNQFILFILNSQNIIAPRISILLQMIQNQGILNAKCSQTLVSICQKGINTDQKGQIIDFIQDAAQKKLLEEKTEKALLKLCQ